MLKVAISDTGRGMEAQEIERLGLIFEPGDPAVDQGDSTGKYARLMLSGKIVRAHRGAIEVYS